MNIEHTMQCAIDRFACGYCFHSRKTGTRISCMGVDMKDDGSFYTSNNLKVYWFASGDDATLICDTDHEETKALILEARKAAHGG